MAYDRRAPFLRRPITRREFLRLTAFPGAVALTGCLGGGDDEGTAAASPSAPASAPTQQASNAQVTGAAPPASLARTAAPQPSSPPAQQSTPPSSGPLAFTLTSPAAQTLAPFSLGHAFRQGDIPSGTAVASDLPNFQATVKNRWPDGSVKFAVLAGRATLTAGRSLSVRVFSGTVSGGANLTEQNLRETGVTASIQFAPYGAVELANLIGVASAYNATARRWSAGRVMEWVSGPEMSSWIYYAPIGADPHLAAWFEVRLWRGGAVEVLPWIENGYLNVPGPTSKSGTATFVLGRTQRYTGAIDLPHHCRVVLAGGTTFSHWLGVDPQVVPRHDAPYLQATRLVPAYYGAIAPTSGLWSRLASTYAPLAQANFPNAIGTAGYHPSIGLLPEWDVAYLTSFGDPRALTAITINGYAAGRYATHYRDETTNRPFRFTSYPNLVLNGANSGVPGSGASSRSTYTPAASGTAPPAWATSHHPSVGFMAYLVTGRWYFMEEAQFSATIGFLKQTDEARQFAKGILRTNVGANTTRGAAWSLRTLAQACCVTPDDDSTLRGELLGSFEENVGFYHATYVAQRSNPQGVCAPYSDYTAGDGKYMHAMWMEDFLTAAWGYAADLGLGISAGGRSRLDAFFSWKAQSIVGRLGGETATEYNYRDAAQYNVAVAPADSVDWAGGTGPWYADWGQVYQATVGRANLPSADTSLRGAYFPDPTSYWGDLQPAIAYAVDRQVPGALGAYQRMAAAQNWGQIVAGWSGNPVWGVKPRSATVPAVPAPAVAAAPAASAGLPTWVRNLPLWQWYAIPNTAMSSLDPGGVPQPWYHAGGPSAKVGAWTGAALKRAGSIYIVGMVGGHNDYAGNEVDTLVLNTETPRWTRLKDRSPANTLLREGPYNLDLSGQASHTYYYLQFIESQNRFVSFLNAGMGSASLPSAPPDWPFLPSSGRKWNTAINYGAAQWEPPGTIADFPDSLGDWTAALCCKHPVTDDVYVSKTGGSGWYRWTAAANQWVRLSSQGESNYCGSAIDPTRNVMLIVGAYSGAGPRVRDLSGASQGVAFSGLGAAALNMSGYPSVVYDEANDTFLVFRNDAAITVFRVRPSDWFVDQPVTTGLAPARRPNGCQNAVQYVPELRGVVVQNSYSGNVYFMRTAM
jgi:hypothetical protein